LDQAKDVLKLVEVARMYYQQELTQSQIASALGVSRPLISNMLQRAKELGIVTIEIRSPLGGDDNLLNRLKERYRLTDGLIVPASRNDLDFSLKSLISQAALFTARKLGDWRTIGLGWGNIVSQLVDALSAEELATRNRTIVCPLIGSMTSPSRDWHPNELARRMSERLAGDTAFLHAPAFPGSSKNYKTFQTTEEYQYVCGLWRKLDTAILEIETYPSVPDQATAMRFGDILKEKQAVGGLLSYYFDIEGNIIEGEKDYVIRIPLNYLRKVRRVLLICSGNTKVQALDGALRLGLVTHLVTDDIAASAILELDR
jgi:deoxyribonucleoside regulator